MSMRGGRAGTADQAGGGKSRSRYTERKNPYSSPREINTPAAISRTSIQISARTTVSFQRYQQQIRVLLSQSGALTVLEVTAEGQGMNACYIPS